MLSVFATPRTALIATVAVGLSFGAAVPKAEAECYRIATWSLEAFELSARRGFPERPDKVPPRTLADIRRIALAIKGPINAKIAMLQQINGIDRPNRVVTSVELEALVRELGPSYRYFLGSTGGHRRLAFVWDTRSVIANTFHEVEVPETRVADKLTPDGKDSSRDIFERDPLIGRFTLLKDGEPRNDLLVVNIDLAFGQWRVNNHDAAMTRLMTTLRDFQGGNAVFPAGERDILVGGNFNSSPFDANKERFFSEFKNDQWKLLARRIYPPTRVSGSQVDYFVATRHEPGSGGLVGDEITDDEAVVHLGLAASGRRNFRRVYSDHFPVTTCIKITQDTD